MSRLAREQGGFSLPELITTLWIGLVLIGAALGLMEFTIRRAGDVERNVGTLQRARTGMEIMTRQLRSQVCLSTLVPPMAAAERETVPGGVREEVTFYTDLSDGAVDPVTGLPPAPEKHTLRYEPAEETIFEDAHVGTYTTGAMGPNIQYQATPDRTRRVLTGVAPVEGQPIFTYYAFTAATPPQPTEVLTPSPALASSSLRRVARIEIQFRSLATRGRDPLRGSTVLRDEVYVRAADPHDPSPIPTCA